MTIQDKELTPSSNQRLIPLTQWNNYHLWPPIGGLRHLVFNAHNNGFERAFIRVGRRVLIDEAAFFECAHGTKKVTK